MCAYYTHLANFKYVSFFPEEDSNFKSACNYHEISFNLVIRKTLGMWKTLGIWGFCLGYFHYKSENLNCFIFRLDQDTLVIP